MNVFKNKRRLLKEEGQGLNAEPKEIGTEGAKETAETEFEEFLKNFPEADAESVLRGVIESGDYKKGAFTRQYVRSLKAELDALKAESESEEAVLEKAMEMDFVKSEIVRDYLKKLSSYSVADRVSAVGSPAVLPPSKPKSIKEAGKLARDIFYNKNN